MSFLTRKFVVCVVLAGITLATYWPVCLNDFIHYDDHGYVTENTHIQDGLTWPNLGWAFGTGYAANWHPLTWISHMLDVQLFGLNPAGHHLTSLLFHTANTILLFLLLRQMTGAQWRSALVAALFALHPLHVESVAWVAERKDVLSTFFGLLSLWAYVRYAQSKVPGAPATHHAPRTPPPVSRFYLLSLLLFALSLMSKAMLVTLPFLLLLLDYWPLGRWQPGTGAGRTARRLLLEKVPFLVFSASAILATLMVQEAAMQYFRQLALSARAANAVVSCARYLGKTFWPEDLAVFYPHPMHWPVSVVGGASVLVVLITGLAVLGWRKRPYCVVGWFWFLGLLVPVLGLVQVGAQAMADRYTYLPLTGIFILLVWGSSERLTARRIPARAGLAAGLLLLVLCAGLTSYQIRFWRNTETIFAHAAAVTRGNWVAHGNLAGAALRRYQDTQRRSVEQQVVHLQFGPPGQAPPSAPLRDDLELVIQHCQQSLQANPGFPDTYVTLAKALTEKGRLDEAKAHLGTAIRLNPTNAETHEILAEIQHRQGRVAEAITEYQAALKLNPDWQEVLNNLAWVLATHPSPEVRNGPEAVRLAARACSLTGRTNLWLLSTLAAAYAEAGDYAQAIAAAQETRRLAAAAGRPDLLNLAETRLQLYQSRRAYREQ